MYDTSMWDKPTDPVEVIGEGVDVVDTPYNPDEGEDLELIENHGETDSMMRPKVPAIRTIFTFHRESYCNVWEQSIIFRNICFRHKSVPPEGALLPLPLLLIIAWYLR